MQTYYLCIHIYMYILCTKYIYIYIVVNNIYVLHSATWSSLLFRRTDLASSTQTFISHFQDQIDPLFSLVVLIESHNNNTNTNNQQPTTNNNQQPTNNQQQRTTNNEQPTTNNQQQPTTNNQQPPRTNNKQQPTTNNQQPQQQHHHHPHPHSHPQMMHHVFSLLYWPYIGVFMGL